jgi:hypothetical protein
MSISAFSVTRCAPFISSGLEDKNGGLNPMEDLGVADASMAYDERGKERTRKEGELD